MESHRYSVSLDDPSGDSWNASTRATGRDPRPRQFDLLIAAVAVDLGIPLIARNENDFRGIHSALSVIAV